jgi:hypothetical protein
VNDISRATTRSQRRTTTPIPISVGEISGGATAVGNVRTGETKVLGETTYSTAVTPQTKDADARLKDGRRT